MLSQFGIEASRAAQYVIAFAIILVLVALFGLVLRKLTGNRLMANGQDRSRARQPRLGVVDIYDLDRQRQLVLLRRDNVEHLLLIGGLNDVVIETNIVRVAGARIPAGTADAGIERMEPAFEQTRPQVESPVRPSLETQLAAQLGSFMKRPSDEMEEAAEPAHHVAPPPVRPPSAPKPEAAPAGKAPTHVESRPEGPAQPFADISAVPRPEAPAIRVEQRSSVFPSVFQSRPTPQPPVAAPPPVSPPVHPVFVAQPAPAPAVEAVATVERATPDAGILSDMAKQLEEALKRPAQIAPDRDRHTMAAAVIEDNSDIEDDDLLEPTAPATGGQLILNDEITIEEVEVPAAPVDEPETAPAAAPPAPSLEAAPVGEAPAAAKAAVPDPFSVEEIEAEFARLLGRPLDAGKKS